MDYLFVYGTLKRKPDGSKHELLKRADFFGSGRVRGKRYTADGYPAAVLNAGAGWIEGEIFRLDDAGLWAALDDYEGNSYRRVLCEIECEQGGTLEAYCYVLAHTEETRS